MDESNTVCEWCGEEIKRVAVICKHCQRDITPKYVDNPSENKAILLIDQHYKNGLSAEDIVLKLNSCNDVSNRNWTLETVNKTLIDILGYYLNPDPIHHETKKVLDRSRYKKRDKILAGVGVAIIALMIIPVVFENTASAPASKVCKAAISTIMGRSTSTISTSTDNKGIVYLSYKRPSDGRLQNYRCYLNDAEIFWATETGRWRTEELISYAVFGNNLEIREDYSDGSSKVRKYELKNL